MLLPRIRASNEEIAEPIALPDQATVVPFIGGALDRVKGGARDPERVDRAGGMIDVAEIPQRLEKLERYPMEVSTETTLEGSFFPAVLLCTGWWEGQHGAKLAERINWRDDDLKHWWFAGFEEWGPSWDLNPSGHDSNRYLLGQLGTRDEADSLVLIVGGSKADELRAKLASGETAFRVQAKGFLQRASKISDEELRKRIALWGQVFNYCLFVSPDEAGHFAHPLKPPARYSGYVWQCWLPRELARFYKTQDGEERLLPPRLHEVYFLWEHTNFARSSVVSYSLNQLNIRKEWLQRIHKDIILVQKSSMLVDGEQELSREDFYRFVMPSSAETGR